MSQIKPKSPCRKDCNNRNASCHSYCTAYLEYEKKMQVFYEDLQAEKNRSRLVHLDRYKR